MARKGGGRGRWRDGVAAGMVIAVAGGLLAVIGGALPKQATASAGAHELPRDVTIASPRPVFMQLSGQGAALSGGRVAWTATTGQGQSGSEADRVYAYDLFSQRLSVPVRSHYGATGFIGSYALVGTRLAYVDTGFTPGGSIPWRLSIVDVQSGRDQTIAVSPPGTVSSIPPQIAFDGTNLLMLQTVDLAAGHHDSVAILFTPAQHRRQELQRVHDLLLSDPALASGTALWTTIAFSPHASSRLTIDDLARHRVRTVPVGDVSQLDASGDLVVWKSGMSGTNGAIGLYSIGRHRVLSGNLARSDRAIFPSIDGRLVSWTYGDGSRVQIYSLSSGRVIYSAPAVRHRVYGLTSVSGHAVSWAYTVLPTDVRGQARGYVVVHQVR